MKLISKRLFVAVSVTAVSALGLGASASAATTDHLIRQSDFDASRTAVVGGATVEFLKQGIHITVPDAVNDYAIGVFTTDVDLADVHAASYQWDGTDNRPGVKLNIDVDGDGTVDCQLQSEQAYGSDNAYLNKDAEDFKGNDGETDSSEPDGYCADHSPKTTGDPATASLDDWATSLGTGAKVVQAGYGASGLKQDGVLESITLGADTYSFTDEAATTPPTDPTSADVTGSVASTKTNANYAVVNLASDPTPAGDVQGKKITWEIRTGPRSQTDVDKLDTRLVDTMGADETLRWTYSFTKGDKQQQVQIFKNGVRTASAFVVRP